MTVAAKAPHAVIYLVSALSFHELTTQIPHEVWIAIPQNSEPLRFEFPPVRTSRLSDAAYSIGIESREIGGVIVRVYSPEKTQVDCIARRNEVGLDVALEALRSYVSRGRTNVDLVMEYASKLRLAKTMRPYLEAMS